MRRDFLFKAICLGLACMAINTQASTPTWKRCEYSARNVNILAEVLEKYKIDKGSYPTTNEGIDLLVKENYLKKSPQDAWGRHFKYAFGANEEFSLTTFGRDGKNGGEGFDADYSWKDDVDSYIEGCEMDVGWWTWW